MSLSPLFKATHTGAQIDEAVTAVETAVAKGGVVNKEQLDDISKGLAALTCDTAVTSSDIQGHLTATILTSHFNRTPVVNDIFITNDVQADGVYIATFKVGSITNDSTVTAKRIQANKISAAGEKKYLHTFNAVIDVPGGVISVALTGWLISTTQTPIGDYNTLYSTLYSTYFNILGNYEAANFTWSGYAHNSSGNTAIVSSGQCLRRGDTIVIYVYANSLEEKQTLQYAITDTSLRSITDYVIEL